MYRLLALLRHTYKCTTCIYVESNNEIVTRIILYFQISMHAVMAVMQYAVVSRPVATEVSRSNYHTTANGFLSVLPPDHQYNVSRAHDHM